MKSLALLCSVLLQEQGVQHWRGVSLLSHQGVNTLIGGEALPAIWPSFNGVTDEEGLSADTQN